MCGYILKECLHAGLTGRHSSAMHSVDMTREAITLILLCGWHVGFCHIVPSSTGVVKTVNEIQSNRPFSLALLQRLQHQQKRSGDFDRGVVVGHAGNTATGGGQNSNAIKRKLNSNSDVTPGAMRGVQLETKRGFQPWGGKRSEAETGTLNGKHPFVMVRKGFQPWGGKRNEMGLKHHDRLDAPIGCLFPSGESNGNKRGFQPWGGKRESTKQRAFRCLFPRLSHQQDLTRNRRGFQPWGGKRSGGKITTDRQGPAPLSQSRDRNVSQKLRDELLFVGDKNKDTWTATGHTSGEGDDGRDSYAGRITVS